MTNRARVLTLAAVALALAASSCTPRRTSRDPFAGAEGTRREGVRSFQVRLEVGCDRCLIRYDLGPSQASDVAGRGDIVWSRRFERYPLQPEAIRLTATTGREGGPLSFVRIYVDGEVVARETADTVDPHARGGGVPHALRRNRYREVDRSVATQFGVGSEVGKLRKVLVHRPDLSLRRLTPSNASELLFDRRGLGAAGRRGARRLRRGDARSRDRGLLSRRPPGRDPQSRARRRRPRSSRRSSTS